MLTKLEIMLEDDLDPRVKRTRQLLVDAFFALIQEKDFNAVTVQDITVRAEVNRATFYAHFEDKYALSNYVIRGMFRHKLTQKLPDLGQFSLDSLQLLIGAVCEFLSEFYSHCHPTEIQMRPVFEAQIQSELYNIILVWVRQLGKLTTTPEVTAYVVSWAIFGAGLDWNKRQTKLSLDQMSAQIYDVLLGGLVGVSDLVSVEV